MKKQIKNRCRNRTAGGLETLQPCPGSEPGPSGALQHLQTPETLASPEPEICRPAVRVLSSRSPEDEFRNGRFKPADNEMFGTQEEGKTFQRHRIRYRKSGGEKFTIEAKSLIISVSNVDGECDRALTRLGHGEAHAGVAALERTVWCGVSHAKDLDSVPALCGFGYGQACIMNELACSKHGGGGRKNTPEVAAVTENRDFITEKNTCPVVTLFTRLEARDSKAEPGKSDTSQRQANRECPHASAAPLRRKHLACNVSRKTSKRQKKRAVWTSYACPGCGKTLYASRRQQEAAPRPTRKPVHAQHGRLCFLCLKKKKLPNSNVRQAYICVVCGKQFVQQTVLALHLQSHVQDKRCFCAICGKGFVQQSLLLIHEKTHMERQPHRCLACGQMFYVKELFVAHQRSHREKKQHRCKHCGKCFADKTSLGIHGRIHTGEKPFPCSVCGKRFTQHSTLVSHQRIHTGEKPFACTECGRQFTDRSAYASHRRTHTGEKPFSCEVCGKRFAQSSNLRRHERIHTGAKP
ncbi:zinc finger protein 585A-like [Spea bombifrons]|uniref:zinc finger protein 585A-like n=1 Tax=Spea bombifrons TaxID=233779 RepID=UPI0023496EE0|nr:zinc finger protein 585A-like [Spea bombifrons]